MEIKKIHIEHFTQFTNLTVELSSDVTVFIGNNGAGKTSLLRALTILLTWFIARIEREKGSGSPILDSDIENDAKYSKITLEVCDSQDSHFQWTLVKQRKGFKSEQSSDLKNLTHLADLYRNRLSQDDNSNLPLIAYDAKNVQCYILDDKQLTQIEDLYGLDANQVLLKVMDTDIRNPEVEKKITVLLNFIQEGELYKAKTALSELEQELSADDLELAKARLLIKRLEVLRAKNH